MGMAHRGRLSVLTHVVGRPYEVILREFEGERTIDAVAADPEGGTGDVKYHLGAEATRSTANGDITVTLAANPSHLEAVDPVVEGRTRAEQTDRSNRRGVTDSAVALPVLIHGDASFAGQGIVAETLNLGRAARLHDRRHAAPDREQPGRVHDRAVRGPLDPLLERPREGLRRADHPRERRRPRGGDVRDPARDGLPPPLRHRRRRRPRRLPALRPQRAGRARVHAAADGARDRGASVRAASSTRRRSSRRASSAPRRSSGSPPRSTPS